MDHRKFEAWLKKHKPNDIVGYSYTGVGCPLAFFMSLTAGQACAVVTQRHRIGKGPWRSNPGWAKSFVSSLDMKFKNKPVTAEYTLDVLERAKVVAKARGTFDDE